MTTTVIDLYDLACRARLLGEIDSQLEQFLDSFEEPKRSSLTPEEPCDKQVNEYTVWLTCRGVEKGETIVGTPNQPLTLSEAVSVYAKLGRDVMTCSHLGFATGLPFAIAPVPHGAAAGYGHQGVSRVFI